MGFLFSILYFVIMFAVILGIFFLCKKYVFPKVSINKWILLGISVVLLLVQMFGVIQAAWWNLVSTPIIVLAFLWFMDIQQTGGPKKQDKKIVIKPKAKPNRAKHLHDNDK